MMQLFLQQSQLNFALVGDKVGEDKERPAEHFFLKIIMLVCYLFQYYTI